MTRKNRWIWREDEVPLSRFETIRFALWVAFALIGWIWIVRVVARLWH